MFETDRMESEPAAAAEWQAMTAPAPKYAGIAIGETFNNASESHAR